MMQFNELHNGAMEIDTVVRFAHGNKYTGCRLHTAMDTQWYSLLDCRNCTGQFVTHAAHPQESEHRHRETQSPSQSDALSQQS